MTRPVFSPPFVVTGVVFVSPPTAQLISMLAEADPASLEELLRPLDLAAYQHIFLPINDHEDADSAGGSHWGLLVFSRASNTFFL